MIHLGDYVQTRRRIPPRIRGGVRGTVLSLDGDTATIELPSGGRFESRIDNLNVLVTRRSLERQAV